MTNSMPSFLKFSTKIVLFSLLLGTLSGCSYWRLLIGEEPRRPEVYFDHAAFKSISLKSLKLGLHFKVVNPNDFAIRLKTLEYKIFYSKTDKEKIVAQGDIENEIVLKDGQQSQVELPLTIHNGKWAEALFINALKTRKLALPYKVKAVFDGPVGDIDVVEEGDFKAKL